MTTSSDAHRERVKECLARYPFPLFVVEYFVQVLGDDVPMERLLHSSIYPSRRVCIRRPSPTCYVRQGAFKMSFDLGHVLIVTSLAIGLACWFIERLNEEGKDDARR